MFPQEHTPIGVRLRTHAQPASRRIQLALVKENPCALPSLLPDFVYLLVGDFSLNRLETP